MTKTTKTVKVVKAVKLDIQISGKDVYASDTGLKWRNGRETHPSMFMVFFTKGERRAVRKALERAGKHKLASASIIDNHGNKE